MLVGNKYSAVVLFEFSFRGPQEIMAQIMFVFPRPAENSPELIYLRVPANPYCDDSTLPSSRLGSEPGR